MERSLALASTSAAFPLPFLAFFASVVLEVPLLISFVLFCSINSNNLKKKKTLWERYEVQCQPLKKFNSSRKCFLSLLSLVNI